MSITIRSEIYQMIDKIMPFDEIEAEQIAFVQTWLNSGVEIFRIEKPATPDTHLVSYFVLVDELNQKILLVDHRKAKLWLPSGGHVELGEHPKETVKREILEELGIHAEFLYEDPFFLTVTKAVGLTAGHTDVSLWYVLKGDCQIALEYDQEEFNGITWFDISKIPYEKSDPHMGRFIQKFISCKTQIIFEPLNEAHIALIYQWFNRPHVQSFYSLRNWTLEEVQKKLTPYMQEKSGILGYVIYLGERPIGYIQGYPIKEYPWENQNLPDGIIQEAAGFDLFIGEKDCLGKGWGSKIVNRFLEEYIWPYYKYCMVDPDSRNEASIRLFQKCGFMQNKQIDYINAINDRVLLRLLIKNKGIL